jgi:AbrB family looped-hinge helix DNA binding protein
MATVTSKRQVTLPKKVTEALGLEPGAQVDFEVRPNGEVVMRKRVSRETIESWRGYLRGKMPLASTDELMTELRGE